MSAVRPRIGLMVPSGNGTVEWDFQRAFAGMASIHSARMWAGTDCTPEAHEVMNRDIDTCARYIGAVSPGFVAYACTSGGFELGSSGEADLVASIAETTGAPAVSATGAIVEQLRRRGVARIALVSPYTRELTLELEDYLAAAGFAVVAVTYRGLVLNDDIAADVPQDIAAFTIAADLGGAEAIVLPCTNWRANEAVHSIEVTTGLPVVTSNAALISMAADALQLSPRPAHIISL